MRISDWSSGVCSSDLEGVGEVDVDAGHLDDLQEGAVGHAAEEEHAAHVELDLLEHLLAVGLAVGQRAAVAHLVAADDDDAELGSASCRERVCQYVLISGVAVSLKKQPTR